MVAAAPHLAASRLEDEQMLQPTMLLFYTFNLRPFIYLSIA